MQRIFSSFLAATLLLLANGCGTPADDQCASDQDCRGSRVCTADQTCVEQQPDANSDTRHELRDTGIDTYNADTGEAEDSRDDTSDIAEEDTSQACADFTLQARIFDISDFQTEYEWNDTELDTDKGAEFRVEWVNAEPEFGYEVEWELVQTPPPSTAIIDEGAARTTLSPDFVGRYSVRATLHPAGDSEPCPNSDTLDVAYKPTESLYVELFWETPGDPDPLSSPGEPTDLDIRYVEPGMAWTAENAVSWRETSPDWGALGSDDDPRVEDKSDGTDPEILTHPEPESGSPYALGVMFWQSHELDFPEVTATVRVAIDGDVSYTKTRTVKQGEFWYVLDLAWPDGTFENVDSIHPDDFPAR